MAQRYPNMAKTLLSQQQMRYGQMRMKVSLNQQRATQLCISISHYLFSLIIKSWFIFRELLAVDCLPVQVECELHFRVVEVPEWLEVKFLLEMLQMALV